MKMNRKCIIYAEVHWKMRPEAVEDPGDPPEQYLKGIGDSPPEGGSTRFSEQPLHCCGDTLKNAQTLLESH